VLCWRGKTNVKALKLKQVRRPKGPKMGQDIWARMCQDECVPAWSVNQSVWRWQPRHRQPAIITNGLGVPGSIPVTSRQPPVPKSQIPDPPNGRAAPGGFHLAPMSVLFFHTWLFTFWFRNYIVLMKYTTYIICIYHIYHTYQIYNIYHTYQIYQIHHIYQVYHRYHKNIISILFLVTKS